MRYWRVWAVILLIGATSFALAVRHIRKVHVQKDRVQRERDAHNQAELLKYSQDLKVGLTRKDVKDYLRAHGTKFGDRCCDEGFRAFAVIVKVGENDHPWFCGEWPVYVAFEFTATGPPNVPFPVDPDVLNKIQRYNLQLLPGDSDVLTKVQLVSNGEGCL
jgi:hypothetical protein